MTVQKAKEKVKQALREFRNTEAVVTPSSSTITCMSIYLRSTVRNETSQIVRGPLLPGIYQSDDLNAPNVSRHWGLLEPLEVYFLASIDGNCTPQSIANYVIGEGDDDPFHTWLSSVNFVSDAFASIASTRHFGSPSFEPGSFQALTHDTDDAMERMANMIT